jgi:hypothetical protein
MMLPDLDETRKQFPIKKAPLEPAEVDISFEAPDRMWAASISKPMNLYLYDMSENHTLQSYGLSTMRIG